MKKPNFSVVKKKIKAIDPELLLISGIALSWILIGVCWKQTKLLRYIKDGVTVWKLTPEILEKINDADELHIYFENFEPRICLLNVKSNGE